MSVLSPHFNFLHLLHSGHVCMTGNPMLAHHHFQLITLFSAAIHTFSMQLSMSLLEYFEDTNFFQMYIMPKRGNQSTESLD